MGRCNDHSGLIGTAWHVVFQGIRAVQILHASYLTVLSGTAGKNQIGVHFNDSRAQLHDEHLVVSLADVINQSSWTIR